MTLQFNPGAYESAFQFGQNRDLQRQQAFAQALQSIPQGIGAIGSYQQQQKESRMNQILTAMKLKEQGVDPTNAMDYMRTGSLPTSSPNMTQPFSPGPWSNPSPQDTPASTTGGAYSSPPSPAMGQGSPLIHAWNNHPDKSQFAPRSGGFGSLLHSQPVDYQKITGQLAHGDTSGLSDLPEKQRSLFNSNREFNQREADRQEMQKWRESNVNVKTSEKQDQMDRKRWDSIIKDTNPYKASSRSALGMAVIGNQRASRAVPVLQNPNATNQDINTAIADISGIFQGGVPTESGMHEQEYKTWLGKLSDLKTLVSGTPSAPAIPEIKQHLIDLIGELKNVNNQTIKDQLDYTETAYPDLIQKNNVAWQGLRKRIGVDQEPTGGNPSGSQPMTATNKSTGQRIQSMDGGKTWSPVQ